LPELAEAEPGERACAPAELRSVGAPEPGGVHCEPATVPRPHAGAEIAPRGDLAGHGLRSWPETVRTTIVPGDEAVGQQPGERHAYAVLADAEQVACSDQGAHGHGATRERRQEVEHEMPRRRPGHEKTLLAQVRIRQVV